jgi:hypothetical protein
MKFTPMNEFLNDEGILHRFTFLGIKSAEEFLALWSIQELRGILSAAVGIDVDSVAKQNSAFAPLLSSLSDLLKPISEKEYHAMSFGAMLPPGKLTEVVRMPDITEAKFLLDPPEKKTVNLIQKMRNIRSQGARATCVAFASSALREYFEKEVELSPQFLYWKCKQIDGIPEREGTYLHCALKALLSDGICTEIDWPYNPKKEMGEDQGPPPEHAVDKARKFRISEEIRFFPSGINDIRKQLFGLEGEQTPVVFSIPVYISWYKNPLTYRTGHIPDPIPGEQHLGGHAMLIVGMDDENEQFIFRNSWGAEWGKECEYGSGYGTISYAFIANHCWSAYSAKVSHDKVFEDDRRKKMKSSSDFRWFYNYMVLSLAIFMLFLIVIDLLFIEPEAKTDDLILRSENGETGEMLANPAFNNSPLSAIPEEQNVVLSEQVKTEEPLLPMNKIEADTANDVQKVSDEDIYFQTTLQIVRIYRNIIELFDKVAQSINY